MPFTCPCRCVTLHDLSAQKSDKSQDEETSAEEARVHDHNSDDKKVGRKLQRTSDISRSFYRASTDRRNIESAVAEAGGATFEKGAAASMFSAGMLFTNLLKGIAKEEDEEAQAAKEERKHMQKDAASRVRKQRIIAALGGLFALAAVVSIALFPAMFLQVERAPRPDVAPDGIGWVAPVPPKPFPPIDAVPHVRLEGVFSEVVAPSRRAGVGAGAAEGADLGPGSVAAGLSSVPGGSNASSGWLPFFKVLQTDGRDQGMGTRRGRGGDGGDGGGPHLRQGNNLQFVKLADILPELACAMQCLIAKPEYGCRKMPDLSFPPTCKVCE